MRETFKVFAVGRKSRSVLIEGILEISTFAHLDGLVDTVAGGVCACADKDLNRISLFFSFLILIILSVK